MQILHVLNITYTPFQSCLKDTPYTINGNFHSYLALLTLYFDSDVLPICCVS